MSKQKHISPPKWADRFLAFYCKEEFLEEIQGDAHELFERRAMKSLLKARLAFIWDVLRFFKLSNIKTSNKVNSNFITMTRNNFKIAARVLWKQKVNTALNIGSITIGMACFILLSLYIKQELTFDKFHEKGERIYRTWTKEDYGEGQVFYYTNSPLPLAPTLEANIPDVEATIQVDYFTNLVGQETDNRINERMAVVSPNFFNVFSFKLLKGNTSNPLDAANQVVLSERYAQKYFGDTEAIGKEIYIEFGEDIEPFVVSAIVENTPQNTGFQLDMVISNFERYDSRRYQAWFNIAPETYVLLKDNSEATVVEAKFPDMINTVIGEQLDGGKYILGLQPLEDIHLNADFPTGNMPVGNIAYVYVLGTVGFLVLIIACINYTTLSTGQSIKRAKEVGVRKVVGAQRNGLVWQYLTESILISIIATSLGLLFAYLVVPTFNVLVGTSLVIPLDAMSLLGFLGLAVFVGLMTGVYPAFVLSNIKLINVLRGFATSSRSAGWMRKALMGFQLFLTFFLISSSILMKKQLNYLQYADKGYNYEAMVSVPLYANPGSGGLVGQVNSAMENGQMLQTALEQNTQLSNFGMGSHVFGANGWVQLGFESKYDTYLEFNLLIVDPHYLEAFDIEMLDGTNFNEDISLHKSQGVILNEQAAEYFRLENPLGEKLPGDAFGDHIIIGVVKDFNFENMKNEIGPLVIVQNPQPLFEGISDFNVSDNPTPKLVFKYNGSSLTDVGTILSDEWNELFPNQELNFSFVEQRLQQQYEEESRVNKMAGLATLISIMIAAFGLLGLTILLVNAKMKEIGIRKVLGASPKTILAILMNHFIVQLVIAFLVSIPVTWYLMNQWLNDFAYRTAIGVDPFLSSAGLTLVIIMLVLGYHALRAARMNPIKSLRTE